jgi:hypothetical protein
LELAETAVESQDIHARLVQKSELYWLDCFDRQERNFLDRHVEALFSFAGLRTRIVDEPGPERLKVSILSEKDAPELREWAVSGWSHRRLRFVVDVNGNKD